MRKFILIMSILLSSQVVKAAEEEPKFWSGDVEVGAIFTSGNTEQNSVKLRADATRETDRSVHSFHGDSYQASQNSVDTAKRFYLFYRYDYKLGEDQSLFGRLAYEEDDFTGFNRQVDLTAGYKRMLLRRDNLTLEGDVGAGIRYIELDTGGDNTDGLIRLAALLKWQISESALFTQFLGFEVGQDLTTTRSETALETAIIGNLAMKLALAVKNNSKVLPGKEKTDTETTVTVVYKF